MSTNVEKLNDGTYKIKVIGKLYESSNISLNVIEEFNDQVKSGMALSEFHYGPSFFGDIETFLEHGKKFESMSSIKLENACAIINKLEYDIIEDDRITNIFCIIKPIKFGVGIPLFEILEAGIDVGLHIRALGTIDKNSNYNISKIITFDITQP